jgi:FkbM family methyltransferase
MRRYHNWPEVIASSARKQFPPRYILRDGTRFEAAGGFKERWQIEDIFFKRAYLPKPLTIRPDDVVIDIGANVGVFSIFAAKRTRNMVYAFEPFPDNCDIFTHVLTINHLSNVILQQVAVSDCTGSASLQVSSVSGTRHFLGDQQILQTLEDYQKKDEHHPFAEVMPGALSDTLEVSTTTLQEIMDRNHLQTVGILKINCEGAEGAIIQATPIAYLQRIQQIFVHFHVHLSLISPDEMQKRLEEAGFTVTREWDGVNPLGYMYGWKPRETLSSLSRQEAAKV